jgi:hypothetical protein
MADKDMPVAVSGSLADEEAAMHKGRGRSLVVVIALAAAAIGGLVFLVGGEDEARVYGEIGKSINGLERGSFNQFWGCALQGDNVTDIRSNSELMTKVGGRGMERGRNYGVHVREKCLPMLQNIGPKLGTLIVPEDLKADVKAMVDANAALRSEWSSFVAYLDNPDLKYDEIEAKPHLQAISKCWFDFRKAHVAINKTIKSKLK